MSNRELDLAKRKEAWLDDPRREALEDAARDAWDEANGAREASENRATEEWENRVEDRARLLTEDEGRDFERLNSSLLRSYLNRARVTLQDEEEERGTGGL
jgi:hypothetical protein